MRRPILIPIVTLAACAHPGAAPVAGAAIDTSAPPVEGAHLLAGTAAAFASACGVSLAMAKAKVAAIKSLGAARHDAMVLRLYDDATAELANASARSGLAREVHPDAAFRDAARDCEQKVEAAGVELAQDRAVYDALAAVDLSNADAATRWLVERTLTEFRRAGVDRDDATRARVKALNDELVVLGQEFQKNIAGDVRRAELDPADLGGLPADYIAAHPAAANGKVSVSSDYPDYFPFMTYAKRASAREKVWRTYRQRAHPKNAEVLDKLIARRHELAASLGYPTWAAYTMETKMTGTVKVAADFIDKVAKASEARARSEFDEILARKRKDDPAATAVEPWDVDYYQDRIKDERFGFDSRSIRPWLEYGGVKQGVLNVTARMFGIAWRRVPDAPVWHPDVEAYDVEDGDATLGRIFLDMHPRPDKYKHAAQFELLFGKRDARRPEGALVCNFPRPGELMTHDEVETFFHEFGHLVHFIFEGRQAWHGLNMVREWDFIEAPSMLLQQWPVQAPVLATFARHHQTGQALPAEMAAKLKASKEFGKGLWTRRQMFLSAVSLAYFSRPPGFDTTAVLVEEQKRLSPFRHEWREGTHFQLAFGHLNGYSAAYYTYIWSTVIAKDLETAFEKSGYLDPATARRYREAVLDPGGSKPAAQLVRDFLGRDYGFEAYRAYLER